MTVTVHKTHVAQISQTEGELFIYFLLLLFIAFAGKNKAGEGRSVALYLYLHPTCPSEGTEKHCIKKKPKPSSGVTAEPKIAPARTNARPLNTLLQHCYWTNTDMCSIHTQTDSLQMCDVQKRQIIPISMRRTSTSTLQCFHSDERQKT